MQGEAKKIIMTTGDHIKADGQVPRKIDNSFPTPQVPKRLFVSHGDTKTDRFIKTGSVHT